MGLHKIATNIGIIKGGMNKELAMILKQYKLLEPDDLPEIEEDDIDEVIETQLSPNAVSEIRNLKMNGQDVHRSRD